MSSTCRARVLPAAFPLVQFGEIRNKYGGFEERLRLRTVATQLMAPHSVTCCLWRQSLICTTATGAHSYVSEVLPIEPGEPWL